VSAVEAPLLGVRDEQAVDAENRGEQQRDPQHSAGQFAAQRVSLEREMEQHEGRHAEQRHRRHGLEAAQLDAELLAQQGGDDRARARNAGRLRRRGSHR
jgi:hypothetical protein